MSTSVAVAHQPPAIPGRHTGSWLSRRPLLRCIAIYGQMPGKFAACFALFVVVNAGLAWQRAFSPRAIEAEIIESLFEAARWAPSARNAQPWLFVVAASEDELVRARPILNDKNRVWAAKAPLLALLFARRHHSDGKPNRSAAFDAGAAWMSLALQAARLGLVTHAMGGFSAPRAFETLGVPEAQFDAQVAIAIGYPGDPSALPPELAEREGPSSRLATRAFVHRGRYGAPV